MSEAVTQAVNQDVDELGVDVSEYDGDDNNESLIPYSFAKKHNVLVHREDGEKAIVLFSKRIWD